MTDKKTGSARLLPIAANASLIALELVGAAVGFASGGVPKFKYYTILSNVFALVSSIAFLVSYLKRGGKFKHIAGLMRYFASCCLAVTFLTVVFVLVPMAVPHGTAAEVLYKGPQLYHHILCPILACLSFIFIEQGIVPDKRLAALACAPTLLYAVVFIILNLLRVTRGPYPFLHVYEQPWFLSVIWFILIGGVAIGSSLLIGKLKKLFAKPALP